jgi:hypothetical protein
MGADYGEVLQSEEQPGLAQVVSMTGSSTSQPWTRAATDLDSSLAKEQVENHLLNSTNF